jgi:hypothetical protein
VVAALLTSCGGDAPAGDAPTSSACAGIAIDRFKELFVVDDGVVSDPRSRNASAGAWSFRHLVENMAPGGQDASIFVREWIEAWASTKELNGFPVDRPTEERASALKSRLLCPWLRRTPENACDEDCVSCTDRRLDLAKAPFRLIALVNRTDLREKPDIGGAGELRFLFALTDGAADDAASVPLPMTVAFEYFQPSDTPAKAWAARWHELSASPDHGELYRTKLAAITESVVVRGALSSGPNGSALTQVRTNESAFNWIWQLREFALTRDGALRPRPLRNTPGEPLNATQALRAFVLANEGAVKVDEHVVPTQMLAGSADQLLFRWTVPGVDERTRHAFAMGTCNGCHLLEAPNVDTSFHVSPFRRGIERLSRHLHDPGGLTTDELARREASARRALCGE